MGVCESETHTKIYSEETNRRRESRTLKSKFVFFFHFYIKVIVIVTNYHNRYKLYGFEYYVITRIKEQTVDIIIQILIRTINTVQE